MAGLLAKHFDEERLNGLYWKMVKAGYIEWDTKGKNFVATDMGVPQGGIISPLLSNLVLHELDCFMQKIIMNNLEINKGKKTDVPNPKYHSLTMKLYRLNKKGLAKPLSTQDKDKRMNIIKERNKLESEVPNPRVLRLKYVRYADD